jgi:hypothetical protein
MTTINVSTVETNSRDRAWSEKIGSSRTNSALAC